MSNEATAMEDGGGSVTREENGNDLFIPAGEMDRWSASPTRRQGHNMARGTAASRLAGRPGQAAAGSRRLFPAYGGAARGDDALAHGRRCEGRGNRRSQECLDVWTQRVPRWLRARRGTPTSHSTSSGAPGARTLQTDLL
jgi:hypothetical protein